jgi:hypothetical protein
MYCLPEDSPKKEKVVFFQDEDFLLNIVKHENTTQLMYYIDDNGMDEVLAKRLLGYAVNMIKPASVKALCLKFPNVTPEDTLRRVFHTIVCELQDEPSPARVQHLVASAVEMVKFLKEYNLLCVSDVTDALEICSDYQMDDILKPITDELSNL